MRKSILALTATGGVFALTAAAASSVLVLGPIAPAGGSAATAQECDLGTIEVHPTDDGTTLTGFKVTSTVLPGAAGNTCTDAKVYVALEDGSEATVMGDEPNTQTYDYYFVVNAPDLTASATTTTAVVAWNAVNGWTAPNPGPTGAWTSTTATAPTVINYVPGASTVVVTEDGAPTTGAWKAGIEAS